jgi:hypothetical protein
MKKFEYIVVEGNSSQKLDVFLNEYGKDGWELCHWERYIDASIYIFKRELV